MRRISHKPRQTIQELSIRLCSTVVDHEARTEFRAGELQAAQILMKPSGGRASGGAVSLVAPRAPGLATLLAYRRDWLRHDVAAGLSVAAVALPTAIAYAQIVGLEPVVGLYAAILPLVVYCLLGTSRHLIVNPDAATCALVAATLGPLAVGRPTSLAPCR